MSNQEILVAIEELLKDASSRDRVEVFANLIAREGLFQMGSTNTGASREEIFSLYLRDRDKNGETIGNSLLIQGLVMLDWLNN
jgi:hypothetical protein